MRTLARPLDAPPLYSQDGQGFKAQVHAHYFIGASDWLITEYDPQEDVAFGWACLGGDRQNAELGYVDMSELDQIRVPLSITVHGQNLTGVALVELDEHWVPVSLSDAIAELDRRQGR